MAAVITSKVGLPEMLLEQDGFSNVSELFTGLAFTTENVSELFKFSFPNLFNIILGYLNPVALFHFIILSGWLLLLPRITFLFRVVEEEKNIYVQTCDTVLTEKLFLI